MKTTTRVAIIGGGVVGCSVLYHLTKLGWSDVMLLERSELTSGSTWHAAGGFHTLNGDTNMAALQGYTIRLYRELEDLTGMSCGLHHVGGVTLADTPARMDFLKAERAQHRVHPAIAPKDGQKPHDGNDDRQDERRAEKHNQQAAPGKFPTGKRTRDRDCQQD